MPDDDIKGMLEEVQRSLDRSRRALEALEQRQQGPGAEARPSRPATLPAAGAPAPPPPGSVDAMLAAVSSPTPPPPSPAGVAYARRRTSAYNTTFLKPADAAPSSPPPAASTEVETGRSDETSEWSSGERPSQRSPQAPSSSPPARTSDRPETGRYTFVSGRRSKK